MSFLRNAGSWKCQELEFLAEYELIDIQPTLTEDEPVMLLSGRFGPFKAEELEKTLEREKGAESAFEPVPFHYSQIATALLSVAADDFIDSTGAKSAARVHELLDDLEKTRHAKLSANIKTVLRSAASEVIPTVYDLTNAGDIEVSYLKSGLLRALDHIVEMGTAQQELDALMANQGGSGVSSSSFLSPGRPSRRGDSGAGASSASVSSASNSGGAFLAAGGGGSESYNSEGAPRQQPLGRLRRGNLQSRLNAMAAAAGGGDDAGAAGGGSGVGDEFSEGSLSAFGSGAGRVGSEPADSALDSEPGPASSAAAAAGSGNGEDDSARGALDGESGDGDGEDDSAPVSRLRRR